MNKALVLVVLLSGCTATIAPAPSAPVVKEEKNRSTCKCSWVGEIEMGKHIFKTSWNKHNLNRELIPVAWNESYNNANIDHEVSVNGPYYTAFGPLGLKPSTAHIEWKTSPKLRKAYPGLESKTAFLSWFLIDVKFYNELANNHWWRLKKMAGGDLLKAAFGWRYGPAFINTVTNEELVTEVYIIKYAERAANLGISADLPETL